MSKDIVKTLLVTQLVDCMSLHPDRNLPVKLWGCGMRVSANVEEQGVLAVAMSRGSEILQGETHLAAYLGVSGIELHRWRDGISHPPQRVFKRLSALLARQ
jgi:hypothetical protein